MPRISPRRRLAVVLVAVPMLAGCGSVPLPDGRNLLTTGKRTVDRTNALHFHLSSSNAQAPGTVITGGDGVAERPGGFIGSLQVSLGGIQTSVRVVSVDHRFYVRLPFGQGFTEGDPAKYGFADPAILLDPSRGLTSLLDAARHPRTTGRDRLNGEELDEVDAGLPGPLVASLLASADPAQEVHATIGINESSGQVRRVVLEGPFFDAHKRSTYTVLLDKYGNNVVIAAPVTLPPT